MNANDLLREHTCTDNYYQHFLGMCYTDGAKALADKFKCYWFLDVVTSYQPQLRDQPFQVWTLKKNDDDSAVVICTDGDDHILQSQNIEYTDFPADDATLWVEGNVILLPSEH